VQHTFSFVGTSLGVLTLEGNANPAEFYLDDVIATSNRVTATPEPSFVSLSAGGLDARGMSGVVGVKQRRFKACGLSLPYAVSQ
jgi:hypothetical protein